MSKNTDWRSTNYLLIKLNIWLKNPTNSNTKHNLNSKPNSILILKLKPILLTIHYCVATSPESICR